MSPETVSIALSIASMVVTIAFVIMVTYYCRKIRRTLEGTQRTAGRTYPTKVTHRG